MPYTDTTVNNLVINVLTQEQYDDISNPSDSELYLITDEDAITAGTGLSTSTVDNTTVINHANSVTPQTTLAVYPTTIDSEGHISAYGSAVTIPSKTSDLINDSGFITSSPVTSVNSKTGDVTLNATDVGATTTSDVNGLIATAIGGINSFEVEIVQSLPTQDIDTHTIYMISNSGSGTNIYDEYMYINSAWEKIGTTETDLSSYVPTSRTINNKALSSDITLTAANVGAVPASTSAAQGDLTGVITHNPAHILMAADNINLGLSSVDLTNKNIELKSSVSGLTGQTSSIILKTISADRTETNNITLSDGATTITGVVTPTSDTMAANKKYVDDAVAGAGSVSDVQVNSTSILSNKVANLVTNTAYNASTNKIATMSDLPTVPSNVSSFTNDAGYLTLATLPIYNGEVSNG